MITIIPCQEILKAVVDDNISGPAASVRRASFDMATELMSLGNIDVMIEGILYERVEHKLNQDHRMVFKSLYRIDDSAKGVTDYNIAKAINWIAKSESNSRKVILISENHIPFQSICNNQIKCLTPAKFLEMVEKAQVYSDNKIFSTLDDALMAIIFYSTN